MRKRYGWDYGIPAYAAASFVGYSRVESGKHYAHDVVAGAAIGIIAVIFSPDPTKDGTSKWKGIPSTSASGSAARGKMIEMRVTRPNKCAPSKGGIPSSFHGARALPALPDRERSPSPMCWRSEPRTDALKGLRYSTPGQARERAARPSPGRRDLRDLRSSERILQTQNPGVVRADHSRHTFQTLRNIEALLVLQRHVSV